VPPLGSKWPGSIRQSSTWRRAARWAAVLCVVGLIGVLAVSLRLPLLVLEPGPAPDIAERTEIDAQTYPSEGSMHLTTAQVGRPKGATAAEVLAAIFASEQVVFPRTAIYPAGRSDQETESIQAAQMTRSELEAAVAALGELGMPYRAEGVFVIEVLQGTPAAAELVAGDVITAVDAKPVKDLRDLNRELAARDGGERVRLEVLRGGEVKSFAVKTTGPPTEDKEDISPLGAKLADFRKAPIEVSISSRDIGGPSAGLMYSLSIYDRLVPEDLTKGWIIAGTGTIDNEDRTGVVGTVGSVGLKVRAAGRIGAQVFMVPKEEAEAAREAAGDGMQVIGVSTLKEAIGELRKLPPAEGGKKVEQKR